MPGCEDISVGVILNLSIVVLGAWMYLNEGQRSRVYAETEYSTETSPNVLSPEAKAAQWSRIRSTLSHSTFIRIIPSPISDHVILFKSPNFSKPQYISAKWDHSSISLTQLSDLPRVQNSSADISW